MRVLGKAVLWTIAVIAVMTAGIALYISYGDLSRHKGRIENLLADATGSDVRIVGAFDITPGSVTRLLAKDVRLLNTGAPRSLSAMSVGEFDIEIDISSLYSGPVIVEKLHMTRVDVHLASDTAAQHDQSERDEPAGDDASPATIIEIREFALTHFSASRDDVTIRIDGTILGSLMAELGSRPIIGLEFASSLLDITLDMPLSKSGVSNATDANTAAVFSDEPFELTMFDAVDFDLSAHVDEIKFAATTFTDFVLLASQKKGTLSVAPVSFRELGAKTEIVFELHQETSRIVASVEVAVDGLHVGTPWSTDADRATLPTLTGSMSLDGEGESLHQFMAASSGVTTLKLGAGRMRSFAGTGLFGDVVLNVMRALNPLHNAVPYTSVECAVISVTVVDGAANIDEFAVQTDKLLIVASGDIQLDDESLNVNVRAKPREGLGISLGGVANSFVKLGGKLSSPELKLDAAGGATTAGAAVVTGGLSLVARGLWDRITAANDICGRDLRPVPPESDATETQQAEQQQ
jgi:uncharacterized protein involved in outer membrane biogenesis